MALFVLALVLFIVFDIAIRFGVKKYEEKKHREEREKALTESLRLDFSREAKSLKRVEVTHPKARLLCVDDEEVILDSFRKILVLDGYCVDTVTTGQEALGLVQSHHYDFVFTDLKMPEMDGHDVVKSVKHLRPDIDVVVITGYATVESAVDCMKHGAMDYIQKPFTEEELLTMMKKSLVKRQDRIAKQLKPKVFVTPFQGAEQIKSAEFAIPGGVFISKNHCWISLTPEGHVYVGIDDFAKKLIGRIDSLEFPNLGMQVKTGQPLFSLKQANHTLNFASPIHGTVSRVNAALTRDPARLNATPYDQNWVCMIEPDHLETDLSTLKIGQAAVDFFQYEIERFKDTVKDLGRDHENGNGSALHVGELESLEDKDWLTVAGKFFER
ncbi:MAG: response regulator [Bacteroidetes bacterium]|nr:response regulator [Bacteroidota bacterium]